MSTTQKKHTIDKRPMTCHDVLNEAYDYDKPSFFSRGTRINLGETTLLIISGTASINDGGQTIHIDDFYAQCERTFSNISALLASEGATWEHVIKTTCYLRDMKDYDKFNIARGNFFKEVKLSTSPASTCVEARLCRPELLVEIETMALMPIVLS